MWWLGFTLPPARLLVFGAVNLLVLIGLSRVAGFEETHSRLEDVLDAFAAYAVAAFASAALLFLLGVIGPGMPLSELVGKVAVQAFPASFGAMIAAKQLGVAADIEEEEKRWRSSYAGQLFLMLAGALFLAFNLAPTEEMVLIAYRMTPWHALGLVALSILLLHVFVYAVGFAGQEAGHESGFAATFSRYTLAGYAVAVLAALYLLWTFGRTDGMALPQVAAMVAVLAFPGAIGAAIARLVV